MSSAETSDLRAKYDTLSNRIDTLVQQAEAEKAATRLAFEEAVGKLRDEFDVKVKILSSTLRESLQETDDEMQRAVRELSSTLQHHAERIPRPLREGPDGLARLASNSASPSGVPKSKTSVPKTWKRWQPRWSTSARSFSAAKALASKPESRKPGNCVARSGITPLEAPHSYGQELARLVAVPQHPAEIGQEDRIRRRLAALWQLQHLHPLSKK